MFEQGGVLGRYVCFGRIPPSRLDIVQVGGADFIGVKQAHNASPAKVAVNLMFGSVDWSNITSGDPHEGSSANSRRKKAVHLAQIGGFGIRHQALVCKVFRLNASPVAQQGEDYVEFSTKLMPTGMVYISWYCIIIPDFVFACRFNADDVARIVVSYQEEGDKQGFCG